MVRAGRSPHRLRVRAAAAAPARAALPLSRPLPPRSNSSSSFPMPLFLLLLLILVLLLEDAGAQQGEWSPGNARRAEPQGRWGRRGNLWDVGSPGREPNLQMRGGGAVRFGAWPDLAQHSLAGLSCKGGLRLLSPELARLYFLTRPLVFLKREKRDPAMKASVLVLDSSGENLWEEKEKFWRCDP